MNGLNYEKALRLHLAIIGRIVFSQVYVTKSKDSEFQHKGLLFTSVKDIRVRAGLCCGEQGWLGLLSQ